MKICLYIPTIPEHIDNIFKIIDNINKQTRLPDEILISISNSNLISTEIIDKIDSFKNIKVIKHIISLDAAENRNFYKNVDSDIIIYHDSDDIMHKQRIEVIENIFNNFDIVNLNHSYTKVPTLEDAINLFEKEKNIESINYIESDLIRKLYFPNNIYNECERYEWYSQGLNIDCAAGPISVKKEALVEIGGFKSKSKQLVAPFRNYDNFKGAEDYEMCMELLFKYNKSLIIDSKLYYYIK
jgi:hypothetical protein